MYRLWLLPFTFFVSSAVQKDTSPSASAQVTIEKGYKGGGGLGSGNNQIYRISSDNCQKWHQLAGFSGLTGSRKVKTIPANVRLSFNAETNNLTARAHAYCKNYFAFTPLQGHSYKMSQRSVVHVDCAIEVIDEATGIQPADLVHRATCQPDKTKVWPQSGKIDGNS